MRSAVAEVIIRVAVEAIEVDDHLVAAMAIADRVLLAALHHHAALRVAEVAPRRLTTTTTPQKMGATEVGLVVALHSAGLEARAQ